jgi:hypothetical protein
VHGRKIPSTREPKRPGSGRPEPANPERENKKSRLVRAHKERARESITPGSANAGVDRMKQVVAEKRQSAASR